MQLDVWMLEWAHGRLEVHALGAMLAPIEFHIKDGDHTRTVQPMWISSWAGKLEEPAKFPKIDWNLRGEWPCVPFGSSRDVPSLTPRWNAVNVTKSDAPPHGETSNSIWTLTSRTATELVMSLTYPATHDIERVERTVRVVPDKPRVELSLKIFPRRTCRIPVALHPTFALDPDIGSSELIVPPFAEAWTFPGMVEPSTILKPDSLFTSIKKIPGLTRESVDISRLPLAENTENVVQLMLVNRGSCELVNHKQNYRVRLEWDKNHLPHLQLWVSNRGRPYYPWHNNLALGIEPMCAAFDLGYGTGVADNPISNYSTCVDCVAGNVWSTNYSIGLVL